MPSDKQSHDPNHVVPINGAKFFCEFKLKCADSFESDDGALNLIDFTKSSIVSLDIVDSILLSIMCGFAETVRISSK